MRNLNNETYFDLPCQSQVCFPCKYVYEQYKGNENKLFESLASCSEY